MSKLQCFPYTRLHALSFALKYLPSINGNVIGAAVFQHVVLLVWQRYQYGVAVAIDTLATSQCTCFQKNQKIAGKH